VVSRKFVEYEFVILSEAKDLCIFQIHRFFAPCGRSE
jgi:hypothetical protein